MINPPQEPDVVPGRRIGAVGFGIVLAIFACAITAFGIESCESKGRDRRRADEGPPIPAVVNAVETRPFSVEAQGLEGNQLAEQQLKTFGWVDRDRGTVRVPINVGIQLWLQKQGAAQQGAKQ